MTGDSGLRLSGPNPLEGLDASRVTVDQDHLGDLPALISSEQRLTTHKIVLKTDAGAVELTANDTKIEVTRVSHDD